jgi:hypothetical protein
MLIVAYFSFCQYLEYEMLNGKLIDELETIWRKYIQDLIEVMFWHFHGGTEKKQEKSQSGWPVF